ncbi:hypothetical protein Leryth_015880 [Lithospermum erythrorhizon]|nr:hypothetical protein Leryth_015880 [Lithospermum erythrorhizon]
MSSNPSGAQTKFRYVIDLVNTRHCYQDLSIHNNLKENLLGHRDAAFSEGYVMSVMESEKSTDTDSTTSDAKENALVEIQVLFFARARDVTGLSEMQLKVSSGTTADGCLHKLIAKFPGLEEIKECLVLALNEEYTPGSTNVKDKDVLAIIPPISGG